MSQDQLNRLARIFTFEKKLREAKSLVEKNSGSTLSNVSKNLDYLVVGEKPTNKKIEQAKTLGIDIIALEELKKLLN